MFKIVIFGWEEGCRFNKNFFQNEGSKLLHTLNTLMQPLHCSKLKGNLIRRRLQDKKRAQSLLVPISSFFCCFKWSSKNWMSRQFIWPQMYSFRSRVRHLVRMVLLCVLIQQLKNCQFLNPARFKNSGL